MVRLNFDGACHPNPGLAAWGCVIVTDTHTHAGGGPVPGTATNNVAEYAALGNGLKEVIKLGVTGQYVECIGDSQLVVNQVNGVWQCHDERLKKCLARVVELIGELEAMGNTVGAVWLRREQNMEADGQAEKAWFSAYGKSVPRDNACSVCWAWVTVEGQSSGVLCDAEQCPYPKLNHGVPVTPFEVPTVEQAQQTKGHAVRGVPHPPPRMPADTGRADMPGVPGGVGAGDAVES